MNHLRPVVCNGCEKAGNPSLQAPWLHCPRCLHDWCPDCAPAHDPEHPLLLMRKPLLFYPHGNPLKGMHPFTDSSKRSCSRCGGERVEYVCGGCKSFELCESCWTLSHMEHDPEHTFVKTHKRVVFDGPLAPGLFDVEDLKGKGLAVIFGEVEILENSSPSRTSRSLTLEASNGASGCTSKEAFNQGIQRFARSMEFDEAQEASLREALNRAHVKTAEQLAMVMKYDESKALLLSNASALDMASMIEIVQHPSIFSEEAQPGHGSESCARAQPSLDAGPVIPILPAFVSPFARVEFDGKTRKTEACLRTLHPKWEDAALFTLSSLPSEVPKQTVRITINNRISPKEEGLLGAVELECNLVDLFYAGEGHKKLEAKDENGTTVARLGVHLRLADSSPLSDERLASVFKEVDEDGNGRLSREEIIRLHPRLKLLLPDAFMLKGLPRESGEELLGDLFDQVVTRVVEGDKTSLSQVEFGELLNMLMSINSQYMPPSYYEEDAEEGVDAVVGDDDDDDDGEESVLVVMVEEAKLEPKDGQERKPNPYVRVFFKKKSVSKTLMSSLTPKWRHTAMFTFTDEVLEEAAGTVLVQVKDRVGPRKCVTLGSASIQLIDLTEQIGAEGGTDRLSGEFDLLDSDSNKVGTVSLTMSVQSTTGLDPSEIVAYFRELDKDANGRLSFDEFLAFMETVDVKQGRHRTKEERREVADLYYQYVKSTQRTHLMGLDETQLGSEDEGGLDFSSFCLLAVMVMNLSSLPEEYLQSRSVGGASRSVHVGGDSSEDDSSDEEARYVSYYDSSDSSDDDYW